MPTIRELREAHGWTQGELAERVGTHANTVARWERGEVQPGKQSWLLLSRVFRRAVGSIQTHDAALARGRGRPLRSGAQDAPDTDPRSPAGP